MKKITNFIVEFFSIAMMLGIVALVLGVAALFWKKVLGL